MLNDRKITITTGRSRYEKRWRPQTLLLSELWERLRSPARGAETISEYLALPKSKQDDLKDVGGFVAGALAGDRRKAGVVAPQRLAAKQGDPVAKSGLVGAFCRVYDVPAAMDKFLPGVYDPTDVAGRYTFTGGSTTGGAVLYDDGKFLYSHHATDPCTGCLCPRDLCSTPCRSEQTAQGI